MARRVDKVKAGVDPVVHNVSSVQSTLIIQIPLKLIINVANNRLETTEKFSRTSKHFYKVYILIIV